MDRYTYRIEKNKKGKIEVWIDKNHEICIRQPMRPGRTESEGWNSEQEAIEWAIGHVYYLTETAAAFEVSEVNKNMSEELERHANRATILQAAALSVFAAKQNEEFSEMFLGEARKSLVNLNMLGEKHQAAIEGIKSNYKEIESWQQILALE